MNFTKVMVLKRPFISDTGKSLGTQTSFSCYDSFTWKMLLKRQFIDETEKTLLSTFTVQISKETELLE